MYQRGVIVFGLLLAMLPIFGVERTSAASATFVYSPSTIRINVGQAATINLWVSSTTQSINAADGTIVLPASQVTPTSVSKAGSIFTNWPDEPGISGSTISFAGGLPTPGYKGSAGKILSFTVTGKSEGTGLITTSNGRILANNAQATNIYSGSNNVTVIVSRVVSGATISSSTHPNPEKWYKTDDLSLTWAKPSGVSNYSYVLSHNGTEQSKSSTTSGNSASFNNLNDGVWTFSLTTNYSDGKTAKSSFTIRIDKTAPPSFVVTVEQNGTSDPRPTLKFKVKDNESGVDRYEIYINDKKIATTKEAEYKLPIQLPGTSKYSVKAFDKAGNVTEDGGEFRVEGFAGPSITDWPKITSVLEPMLFKGMARYDSEVILYIDGQEVGSFVVKDSLSDTSKRTDDLSTVDPDDTVEWSYTHTGVVSPGKHLVYAHQKRPDGALSNRSNEVNVTVLWTVIEILGYRIPTILFALGVVTLLVVLMIVGWYRFRVVLSKIRKRAEKIKVMVNKDLEKLEQDVESNHDISRESIELTKVSVDNEIDGIVRKTGQSDKDPPNETK